MKGPVVIGKTKWKMWVKCPRKGEAGGCKKEAQFQRRSRDLIYRLCFYGQNRGEASTRLI